MDVNESPLDKLLRRQREELRGWTVEKERAWLERHPDDTPVLDIDGDVETKAPDVSQHDDDLVPDIEPYERSEADEAIDRHLDRLGIVEAINRWHTKGVTVKGNRSEGEKFRCPTPEHADNDPSAWINTEEGVWYCGGCEAGGDKYDIAAYYFGYPVPSYKTNGQFPELRRKMAEQTGLSIHHSRLSGKTHVIAEDHPSGSEDQESEPDPEPESTDDDAPLATVTRLTPAPTALDDDDENFDIPWEDLIPHGTFLRTWMETTSQSDVPEEYYFWLGLQALGLAVGKTFGMQSNPPVYPNFFLSIVGRSGYGKSRAVSLTRKLLREAFPYDEDDPSNTGVKMLATPKSAQYLIHTFDKTALNSFGLPEKYPVKGFIDYGELAQLIKVTKGENSHLAQTLMEFHDLEDVISTGAITTGSIEIRDPFCSVVATTQHKSIKNLLHEGDADSGFVNRWVFVFGRPKERIWGHRPPLDISSSVDSLVATRSWASMNRSEMRLSGDAEQRWVEFAKTVLEPAMDEEHGKLGLDLLNRCELHFYKLFVLFALNKHEREITLQTVNEALTLWDYLYTSYARIGKNIGYGPDAETFDKIMHVIDLFANTKRKPPTARDFRNFGHIKDDAVLHRVVRRMLDLGDLEEQPDKVNGRAVVRYKLGEQ